MRGSVLLPPFNGKGLRNIQRNMSMVLDIRFHIWFIMTVCYKMRQNATAILSQNASEVYYKMRLFFYYKMRQLLQNVTFITNCNSTLTVEQSLKNLREKMYPQHHLLAPVSLSWKNHSNLLISWIYMNNFTFSIYWKLTLKMPISYLHVKRIYFSLVSNFVLLLIARWWSPKGGLTNYILRASRL